MDTYSLPLQTVKLICNCDNISRGETSADCWRQTKTHLFLTSRTQLGGRPGLACRGGSQSFNILCRLIKDSKSWLVAVRSLVVVVDNLCLHSDTSDIRQLVRTTITCIILTTDASQHTHNTVKSS